MQKNKLAMCKRIFKGFQATKIVDDEKFLIIDWKNKDGSGEYAIRYSLDMEKGNFILAGIQKEEVLQAVALAIQLEKHHEKSLPVYDILSQSVEKS